MAEYIERDVVLEIISRYEQASIRLKGEPIAGAACIAVEVEDIPAADVRPVVKARWIPTGETAEVYGDVYKCSACGCCDIDEMDFCPNCGAKMEES